MFNANQGLKHYISVSLKRTEIANQFSSMAARWGKKEKEIYALKRQLNLNCPCLPNSMTKPK